MKTGLCSIQLERSKNLRDQIRDAVRELLVANQFAPGEKLPSTRELAGEWGTDVRTVHTALAALEKEGLLVRRNRKGTFVQQREEKLTRVGIYYAEDTWTKQSSDFLRTIHAILKEELDRLGVRTQVWIDPRPPAEQAAEWTELRRAAEHREIQGLIVLQSSLSCLQWLNKLPVPSAFLTSANFPSKVESDLPQLAELSLRCLAQQGCRSVGLIFPVAAAVSNPAGPRNSYGEFYERFIDVTNELGLTMRNEWMRIRSPEQFTRSELRRCDWQEEQEQYGYEEFLELWSQPQRPDGLVIHPDSVARGVILGLREQQVRVPEDLRLAISKNDNIPLFCPVPVTFLVSSDREYARALIEQVQKQFRGETCEPISVPFRPVAHSGNSQGRTNKQPNRKRS